MNRGLNTRNVDADATRLSVIIPFYGTEAELRRCLESLRTQTERHFEVVIIADGMPLPPDVVRDLQQSGITVSIRHNETNLGAFKSRLRGADIAVGEFLWFLDHDDTVDANFIEVMLDAARRYSAQVVECPFRVISENNAVEFMQRFAEEQTLVGANAILGNYLKGASFHNLANKIIDRSLFSRSMQQIGPLAVEKLNYAEDMLCALFVYKNAEAYRSTRAVYYNYFKRADSNMNSRDVATIKNSLRSLEVVMSKVVPLIRSEATASDIDVFLERELLWALNRFLQLANGHATDDIMSIMKSLYERYLAHLFPATRQA